MDAGSGAHRSFTEDLAQRIHHCEVLPLHHGNGLLIASGAASPSRDDTVVRLLCRLQPQTRAAIAARPILTPIVLLYESGGGARKIAGHLQVFGTHYHRMNGV